MDGILIIILIMTFLSMAESFYLFSKSKKENLKIKEEYKNLIIVLRRLDFLLTVKAKKTGALKNDDLLRYPQPSTDGDGSDGKNGMGKTKNIAKPLKIKRGNQCQL